VNMLDWLVLGFRRGVNWVFALLGLCAAAVGKLLGRFQKAVTLDIGQTGCSGTL